MLATRLVRLIEAHSDELSRGLTERILTSPRSTDFRTIKPEELQLAASEVYQHLGEWLMEKTEKDIAARFTAIASRRAAQKVRLHQFVWALTLSRDHLWNFLRRQGFAENIVELYGELELQGLLNQFFDRAIYYGIAGYEESGACTPKGSLAKARELAISIGLASD